MFHLYGRGRGFYDVPIRITLHKGDGLLFYEAYPDAVTVVEILRHLGDGHFEHTGVQGISIRPIYSLAVSGIILFVDSVGREFGFCDIAAHVVDNNGDGKAVIHDLHGVVGIVADGVVG